MSHLRLFSVSKSGVITAEEMWPAFSVSVVQAVGSHTPLQSCLEPKVGLQTVESRGC